MKNIFKLFILVIVLNSCKGNDKKTLDSKSESKVKIEYSVDSVYNNYAQRVAAKDTTPFNDIDQSALVS